MACMVVMPVAPAVDAVVMAHPDETAGERVRVHSWRPHNWSQERVEVMSSGPESLADFVPPRYRRPVPDRHGTEALPHGGRCADVAVHFGLSWRALPRSPHGALHGVRQRQDRLLRVSRALAFSSASTSSSLLIRDRPAMSSFPAIS